MAFPEFRARRLRDHPILREMVAETDLSARHLVQPLFIKEGLKGRREIASLPDQAQWGLDALAAEAKRIRGAGPWTRSGRELPIRASAVCCGGSR